MKNAKRKFIIILIGATLLLILQYLSSYKKIELEDIGVLKIPKSWGVSVENEILYFTDHDDANKIYMGGVLDDADIDEGNIQQERLANLILGRYEYKESIYSEIFSNGSWYFNDKIIIDKNEYVNKYIRLEYMDRSKSVVLYCNDESVSEKQMRRIAKSFIPIEYT